MHSTSIKVSVVIPVFNAEQFIERALRSVIDQILPPHEIIVVDDGSTDRSVAIASLFSPTINIVKQSHSGQAAARNKGVEQADGEWICFLDADDWYYPDHLLHYARSIEREPSIECIFGACDLRRPDGSLLQTNFEDCEVGRRLLRRAGQQGETKLSRDDLGLFGEHDIGNMNTFCVKKNVFMKLGGFPSGFKIGEDKYLWLTCVAFCTEIAVICQPTACYVQHPNSTFKRGSLEANEQTVQASAAFLRASKGFPPPLRRGLKRRLKRDRLNLAYAYARIGQRARSIKAVLPSLWEYPSFSSIKDIVSMILG
jgi:glycosyltransferase involved in cell wall biosynthesis